MKLSLLIIVLMAVALISIGQNPSDKRNLYAKSEIEVYQIFEQLLDTTIRHKKMSFFSVKLFNSKDTLMKIEQNYYFYRGNINDVIYEPNRYNVYISKSMSIDFYKRFGNYLNDLGKSENIFYKLFSLQPLYALRTLMIERYETKTFDSKNNEILSNFIENLTLRILKEGYNFYFLRNNETYLTETIKNAIIEVVNDPFYPECYLDYYLEEIVDTSILQINDIPEYVINQYKRKGFLEDSILRSKYESRICLYLAYKKIAEDDGVSIVDAFLNEKKKKFMYHGFLDINDIAFYAVKTRDSLLISNLKAFTIKYPEYQLTTKLP
jgi:hypothetical protein